MKAINLIPQRRLQSRIARRRIRAWAAGASAYAAIIAITCLIVRFSAAHPASQTAGGIDHVSNQVAHTAHEIQRVSREISELQGRLDAAKTVGCHPDWSLLLNAVASLRGEEVVLESVEIVPTKLNSPAPRPTVPVQAAASNGSPKPSPTSTADRGPAKEPETEPQSLEAYTMRLRGLARKPGQPFAFARELEHLGVLDQVRIKETRSQRLGSLEVVWFDLSAVIADRVEGAPR